MPYTIHASKLTAIEVLTSVNVHEPLNQRYMAVRQVRVYLYGYARVYISVSFYLSVSILCVFLSKTYKLI